jgi:hypothetical protein
MHERGVAVLIILSLLGCRRSDAQAEKRAEAVPVQNSEVATGVAPQFVVSSDPAEAVIRVTIESGFIIGLPTSVYTLYGDGRLELAQVRTHKGTGGPPVAAERSVRLDAEEMHSLAALAAAPILVEGNREALANEFETVGAKTPDGSLYTVEVHLMSYSSGGVHLSPVERTFRMVSPTSAAKDGRGGKAIQALAAIVNGLHGTLTAKERAQ